MKRFMRFCVLAMCLIWTLSAEAGTTRVNFITAGQEADTPTTLTTAVAVKRAGLHVSVWVEMSAGSDTYELVCFNGQRAAWISVGEFTGTADRFNDAAMARFTPGDDCTHFAIFRQTSTGTVTTTSGNPRAYIVTDVRR